MIETKRNQSKLSYLKLDLSERTKFVDEHFGFLQGTANALAAQGYVFSLSTVSRSWYCGLFGGFRRPNPLVVAALDRSFKKIHTAEARTQAA